MQEYFNGSPDAVEAKYVFPLDDTASVYGFEAFIMGKHVVGVCKEKEQARREYKEAVSKGHGACVPIGRFTNVEIVDFKC